MAEDMTCHGEAPLGSRVPGLRRPQRGTAAGLYHGAAHYWHQRARRAELAVAVLAAVACATTTLAIVARYF
jgi:hypothetical protein